MPADVLLAADHERRASDQYVCRLPVSVGRRGAALLPTSLPCGSLASSTEQCVPIRFQNSSNSYPGDCGRSRCSSSSLFDSNSMSGSFSASKSSSVTASPSSGSRIPSNLDDTSILETLDALWTLWNSYGAITSSRSDLPPITEHDNPRTQRPVPTMYLPGLRRRRQWSYSYVATRTTSETRHCAYTSSGGFTCTSSKSTSENIQQQLRSSSDTII